jgi:hypothetical protein
MGSPFALRRAPVLSAVNAEAGATDLEFVQMAVPPSERGLKDAV